MKRAIDQKMRRPLLYTFYFLITFSQALQAAGGSELPFYRENPGPIYTHEIPLRVVTIANSSWKPADVNDQLNAAAEVYAQCGVKLVIESSLLEKNYSGEVSFDLEGYSDPSEPHEPNGSLALASAYVKPSLPTLFFMESFDPQFANISATAMPLERIQYADQKPALNSVWISFEVQRIFGLSPEEGGNNPGYSVVAHELGHVILNSDHETNPQFFNLMHESPLNLNGRLTLQQCHKIRSSPLARKLSSPVSKCPQIQSPLRGGLIFLDDLQNGCALASQVYQKLEKINDSISDLQPLQAIDFYFTKSSDLIQYLDRGAFEASLQPSYDAMGQVPLLETQADVLWMHELGHAILNAQLAADWPWYKERQKLYRRWGQAVLESTELELTSNTEAKAKRLEELNQIANIQTDLISRQENSKIFEEIITPYHEFFADAVAVIYLRDPLALKTALQNPLDPTGAQASDEEKQALSERDFSFLRNTATWNSDEPHAMLTPSQAYLWNLIKSKRSESISNQQLIRWIYESVKSEILARTSDPKLWKLPSAQVNERLILILGNSL